MLFQPFWLEGFSLPFFTSSPAAEKNDPAARPVAEAARAPRSILAPPAAHAAGEAPEQPEEAAPPPQNNLTREAMQRRQEELARKEQDLRILEKDLDDRLMRLQGLEMRLAAMLREAEEVRSGKFRQIVDVYSNMKARQAAEVLTTLDEKIAVKILSGMRGRQAGEILNFVPPAKAARLSEALARVQLPFE